MATASATVMLRTRKIRETYKIQLTTRHEHGTANSTRPANSMKTQGTLILSISTVLGLVIIAFPRAKAAGQSCRSLATKIEYNYDPTHRFYPNAAVVLKVQHSQKVVSVTIAVPEKSGGTIETEYLRSDDLGEHWSRVPEDFQHAQIFFEGPRQVARSVVSEQLGAVLDRHAPHAGVPPLPTIERRTRQSQFRNRGSFRLWRTETSNV
jgi:hypothetical protein